MSDARAQLAITYAAAARYRAEVDDLSAFHRHASHHLWRRSNRAAFMITDERVASAIVKLGQMATLSRRLLGVSLEIIRAMSPNAASKEWQVQLFRAAAIALSEDHVDVERATGPEACRWSDATTPYTTGEKLLVLETLCSLCDEWMGPSLAAQALATELRVRLPEVSR